MRALYQFNFSPSRPKVPRPRSSLLPSSWTACQEVTVRSGLGLATPRHDNARHHIPVGRTFWMGFVNRLWESSRPMAVSTYFTLSKSNGQSINNNPLFCCTFWTEVQATIQVLKQLFIIGYFNAYLFILNKSWNPDSPTRKLLYPSLFFVCTDKIIISLGGTTRCGISREIFIWLRKILSVMFFTWCTTCCYLCTF